MKRRAANLTKKMVDDLKSKDLKAIVDEAREWSADHIVLGSHGYTGIKRLFMGSAALSVVGHAPCPVEVVRKKLKKSR